VAPGLLNNEFAARDRIQFDQTGTYCARASARGTATAIVLRLYVGTSGQTQGEMFVMPGPQASWSRLPPTTSALRVSARAGDEGLVVFSDLNRVIGATIEVDDVAVWFSRDGLCRER
jgi:hypothetical protein